jgi:hypothetical protein
MFGGRMLCVRAPWRSSQWVYALRSCSVKVVSLVILIKCCETTFKVAITRKAYTPYQKGSETTSKVAVSRKALRPPKDTFHPLMEKTTKDCDHPVIEERGGEGE